MYIALTPIVYTSYTVNNMNTAHSTTSLSSFRILEEAHEAITKLKTLSSLLTPQDQETLALLMDKELARQLEQSVDEAKKGKLEPLESILE